MRSRVSSMLVHFMQLASGTLTVLVTAVSVVKKVSVHFRLQYSRHLPDIAPPQERGIAATVSNSLFGIRQHAFCEGWAISGEVTNK